VTSAAEAGPAKAVINPAVATSELTETAVQRRCGRHDIRRKFISFLQATAFGVRRHYRF
jgi:hypothetical protein